MRSLCIRTKCVPISWSSTSQIRSSRYAHGKRMLRHDFSVFLLCDTDVAAAMLFLNTSSILFYRLSAFRYLFTQVSVSSLLSVSPSLCMYSSWDENFLMNALIILIAFLTVACVGSLNDYLHFVARSKFVYSNCGLIVHPDSKNLSFSDIKFLGKQCLVAIFFFL